MLARALLVSLLVAGLPSLAGAAGPVASTEVPRAFLEGGWYFSVGVDGGSDPKVDLCQTSKLQRVTFGVEERFLSVNLAEELQAGDRSTAEVLARFPVEALGDRLCVRWGDDPTPFVVRHQRRTNQGTQTLAFTAEGPCDVADFAQDEAAGVITFVKRLAMVCKEAGATGTWQVRYSFLRERPTKYQPKAYRDQAEYRRFGYFVTQPDVLANQATGLLQRATLVTRLDLSRPFVYEIHPGVPEVCRKPIRDAVESWNDVFERRCSVRPLQCVDGQDDHMPGDLRWHVIYFRPRGWTPDGYGAYGPSVPVARTGEIVDADVVVDGTALMGEQGKQRRLDEQRRPKAKAEAVPAPPGAAAAAGAEAGAGLTVGAPRGYEPPSTSFSLGRVALSMAGVQPDRFDDPLAALSEEASGPSTAPAALDADQRFYYLVRGLICHELGHNLGLRHNFAGSADSKNFPSDQMSSSIMDYIQHDQRFYKPCPYDEAALAFGYDGKVQPGEERRFVYATDDDTAGNALANQHDQGEPLDFYQSKIDPLLAPLRLCRKPTASVELTHRIVDNNLAPVVKFINTVNDERSDEAFAYVLEILSLRFMSDAEAAKYDRAVYKSKAHLSRVRMIAGWYLLGLGMEGQAGVAPTRRQRMVAAEEAGKAIADHEDMLEGDRLILIQRLALVKHVSTRKALRDAKAALDATLKDAGLDDRAAEVEENVLMRVEQALREFQGSEE